MSQFHDDDFWIPTPSDGDSDDAFAAEYGFDTLKNPIPEAMFALDCFYEWSDRLVEDASRFGIAIDPAYYETISREPYVISTACDGAGADRTEAMRFTDRVDLRLDQLCPPDLRRRCLECMFAFTEEDMKRTVPPSPRSRDLIARLDLAVERAKNAIRSIPPLPADSDEFALARATARLANKLDMWHERIGDYEGAIPVLENQQYLLRLCYGASEDVTAQERFDSLIRLAEAYREMYRYHDAESIHNEALRFAIATYGAQSVQAWSCHAELASDMFELNQRTRSRAIELEKLAYDSMSELCGADSREALAALGNLAWMYSRVGDAELARELFGKAYGTATAAYGPQDDTTLRFLDGYAYACTLTGRNDQAGRAMSHLHNIYAAKYGADSDRAVGEELEFADFCIKNQRFDDAVDALLSVLGSYRRLGRPTMQIERRIAETKAAAETRTGETRTGETRTGDAAHRDATGDAA